uniref:Carboxylesterase type B domain-containing protein n=1 Tax=Panagrolaimus sp. JU765 TaxID=591449 RepID=A0AC34RCG9_9BILA
MANVVLDPWRRVRIRFGIQASAGMGLDAKRYVLGGIEGGAVLAEYLIHFPEIAQNISGLFLFGGSALSPWASTPDIFNNSLDFAHDLGINFKNSSQLIASMQSIQPKKIFEVQERRRMSKDSKHFVEFTPTFDKANFGKNDFLESIKSLPSIPVFMITSSNEGAIRSVPIQHGYYKVFNEFTGIPVEQQSNFTCSDFDEFITKMFPNVDVQKVIEFYACTGNEQKSPFEIYNEFLGDFNFYVPQAFTALIYAAYDARVYVTVVKTDDDLMEMEAGFSELPHSLIADDYLFATVKPHTRTMAAESMEKYQYIKDQLITDIIQFVKKSQLNFPPHGYYKVFNEFTGIPVDQQANFTCTDFHAFTAKIFPNVDIQKVIEFYACTGNEQKSPFEIYNEFLGDFNFYVPQAFTALIYAAYDARVYVTVVKTDDDLMEMEAGFSELPHSLIADDYLFSSVKPNTRTMAAESMEKYQFIKDQLITDIIQFVKKSELNFPPVPPTSYAISKLPHKLVTSNSAEFVENDTFFAPKLIFWTKFLSTVGFKELSTIFQNKTSLFE